MLVAVGAWATPGRLIAAQTASTAPVTARGPAATDPLDYVDPELRESARAQLAQSPMPLTVAGLPTLRSLWPVPERLSPPAPALDDVLPFFGVSSAGCSLAYNNGVMTALWGALADGDVEIVNRLLIEAARRPDHAAWLNYVRCHDDLIWNALAAYAPAEDLKRWSRFYDGGGFSDGRRFQTAPGGVPSTNGMTAALVGIGKTGVDQASATARLKLLYGVIHALDGWPLIYMGDEIAQGNDLSFLDDPQRAHEGRWLHRPAMDWAGVERAGHGGPGDEALGALRVFAQSAAQLTAAGVKGRATPVQVGHSGVLAFTRADGHPFLCLANFTAQHVSVVRPAGVDGVGSDMLTSRTISRGPVDLSPYEIVWWSAAV
jgi:amylosucrase